MTFFSSRYLNFAFWKMYKHELSSLRRRMSSTLSVATTSEQKRWVADRNFYEREWDPHPTVSWCYKTVWRVENALAFFFFCLRQVYLADEVTRYSTLGLIFLFQYVSQLSLQNTAAGSPSALWAVWHYSCCSNALGIEPPPPSLALALLRSSIM